MTERISGVTLVRHAVLTFAGSWAAPGTGYPSDVVNAADPDLVFEVPIDAPWSFGTIPPGAPISPSYAQSVEIAVINATDVDRRQPAHRHSRSAAIATAPRPHRAFSPRSRPGRCSRRGQT